MTGDDVNAIVDYFSNLHLISDFEENPDEYLIRLAASIAALYSKAHQSSSVPINYTKIQYLKKAPGSMIGKVILNSYKTIYIDPEKEILNTIEKQ